MKILVVEDEKNIRETISDILESQGYQVIEASNGLVGSIKAVNERPHLILCDINMPEMNGFEMLCALKSVLSKKVLPPFIFLTALVNREDTRRGMTLGADDYITKPFKTKELLDAIQVNLKKREEIENKIVSKERSNISSELHDSVQQLMIASLMGFQGLHNKITSLDPNGQSIFKSSLDLLRQATNDLRVFSHEVGQTEMVHDIGAKLQLMSENLGQSVDLKFNISCSLIEPLNSLTQTHLYRLIQEAVNNTLKHAEATTMAINLESNSKGVRLLIVDDGKGFNTSLSSEGTGLQNMEKRAAEIHGNVEITSDLGKGTTVLVLIASS
ncbi:MAG: signal transduction histidine kinase [Cyclobacteriaceae bacterium]|jgi:signal transduction histidine kinase